MPTKNLPYIIIFDIKNTIIGDINIIKKEYDILCKLCKNNKLGNITNECIKFDITENLNDGVIRPFVKEFMDFCKTKYKNVEFFINIYSNDYDSQHIFYDKLVENIEKILDIKFNKPILYLDPDEYDKIIIEPIIKSLNNKYKNLEKNKEYIYDNRLVYISTLSNEINDKKIIKSPVYNYYYYYDIENKLKDKYGLSEDTYKNEIDYLKSPYSYDEIHNDLTKIKLKIISEISRDNNKDTFFRDLIKIIEKADDGTDLFNIKNIKKIKKQYARL